MITLQQENAALKRQISELRRKQRSDSLFTQYKKELRKRIENDFDIPYIVRVPQDDRRYIAHSTADTGQARVGEFQRTGLYIYGRNVQRHSRGSHRDKQKVSE